MNNSVYISQNLKINSITVINIHDLYALWGTKRDDFPQCPERTLKLRGDVSVDTRSSTQGQGFTTKVLITQILPPQRRGIGNSELDKSSRVLKNTLDKAL